MRVTTRVVDRDFIRAGRSRIDGTGVFAKRKIPKGARIIEYTGARVPIDAKAASKPDTKVQSAAKTGRVVLAAAMLGLPAVMVPQQAAAQSTVGPPISPTKPIPPMGTAREADHKHSEYLKIAGMCTVMGVGDGHTIFRDTEGAVFHLDSVTGDKQAMAADYFLMLEDSKGERSTGKIKFTNVMIVSILGADAHGNTVMRNARNETFTLDPRTGNKVLIKWPK
ncbi:MAG: hypothetical protein C0497_11050 [Gemmatimonas sp.]|nr:hypothetical protein [Gemmatimonas sp.]